MPIIPEGLVISALCQSLYQRALKNTPAHMILLIASETLRLRMFWGERGLA